MYPAGIFKTVSALSRSPSDRAVGLVVLLFFLVLSAQTIELAHVHEDFKAQTDCHICLKLGSGAKAVSQSFSFIAVAAKSFPNALFALAFPAVVLLAHRSRGPPRAWLRRQTARRPRHLQRSPESDLSSVPCGQC
ncbi:MAG: hypothetical protein R3F50_21350 [Gammaproteobacteria bacterium]